MDKIAEMQKMMAEMKLQLEAAQREAAAAKLMAEKAQKSLWSLTSTGLPRLQGVRGSFGVTMEIPVWDHIYSDGVIEAFRAFRKQHAAAIAAGEAARVEAKQAAKGKEAREEDEARLARVAAYQSKIAGVK